MYCMWLGTSDPKIPVNTHLRCPANPKFTVKLYKEWNSGMNEKKEKLNSTYLFKCANEE